MFFCICFSEIQALFPHLTSLHSASIWNSQNLPNQPMSFQTPNKENNEPVSEPIVEPPSVKCEPQDPDDIPEFDTSDLDYSLKNENSNLLDSIDLENNSVASLQGEQKPMAKKFKKQTKKKRRNSQAFDNGAEGPVYKKTENEDGSVVYSNEDGQTFVFNKDEVKSYKKVADVFAELSAPKARKWERQQPIADGQESAGEKPGLGIVKKGRKNWKDWSVLRGITISERCHNWKKKKNKSGVVKEGPSVNNLEGKNVKTKVIAIGRHRKRVAVEDTGDEMGEFEGMTLFLFFDVLENWHCMGKVERYPFS